MPVLPTTLKGAATSRRILDAAAVEFAERGIAGARIDRIIAVAQTNKAQLYGYFGGKDGLFDAVIADCLGRSSVPFDASDLPGWAVGLYDENLRSPAIARLLAWIRLERRPGGLVLDGLGLEPKIAAIAAEQAAGRVRAADPADILALVAGMAAAWSPASTAYAATADEPDAAHERRRVLLRETVARAVAP